MGNFSTINFYVNCVNAHRLFVTVYVLFFLCSLFIYLFIYYFLSFFLLHFSTVICSLEASMINLKLLP